VDDGVWYLARDLGYPANRHRSFERFFLWI